jgi:sugar phosphate permease
MLLGGGVGAGSLALLVGIALPQLAASVSTALLGVLLMMGGVVRLAGLMPESVAAWLPDTPRGTVVAVLGAAVIGALVQWTILRKRADS